MRKRQHKLTIFVLTTGEKVTIETLDRLQEYATRDYELVIWYHPFVFNPQFFVKLCTYTKDVIFCTKNWGTMVPTLFSMLCLDSDYILFCCADVLVNKGYMETLFKPFEELEKVATTGESYRKFAEEYVVNDPDNRPDCLELYSKDAINELGANTLAFYQYGHLNTEWQMRAMQRGWKVIAVKGTSTHDQTVHAGRDAMKNWQEEYDKSCKVQLAMERRGFTGYNWWSDTLNEK